LIAGQAGLQGSGQSEDTVVERGVRGDPSVGFV
jgi:hypothetical protein